MPYLDYAVYALTDLKTFLFHYHTFKRFDNYLKDMFTQNE